MLLTVFKMFFNRFQVLGRARSSAQAWLKNLSQSWRPNDRFVLTAKMWSHSVKMSGSAHEHTDRAEEGKHGADKALLRQG